MLISYIPSKDRDEVYLTDEVLKSAHRLLAVAIFGKSPNQVDLKTAQNMGVSFCQKCLSPDCGVHISLSASAFRR